MNTQDIRQEDLEVETEAVETVDTTLQIQTGVQAGFLGDLMRALTFKSDPLGLIY